MAIHAATAKRAKALGIILQEVEGGEYRAFWPKKSRELFDENPRLLVDDMAAVIEIVQNYRSFTYSEQHDNDQRFYTVTVKKIGSFTDAYLSKAFDKARAAWAKAQEGKEEGDDEEEEGEEVETSGSVVSPTYRARYAEAGHPTHCGDWLATQLISRTTNKAGVNVEMVDAIAAANGVNLDKYDRTRHGWQGRLRMTMRNLLARKVWAADGVLNLHGEEPIKAPAEWMQAQRFKGGK
jgi:hypothetical protein